MVPAPEGTRLEPLVWRGKEGVKKENLGCLANHFLVWGHSGGGAGDCRIREKKPKIQ